MLNVNSDMDTVNSTLNITNEEVIEGSHGGPYMVEKIVGIYMGKDYKKYFRVKWLDSWEPAENLSDGCKKLIDDFWSGTANAGKPMSKDNLQMGQKIIKTEVISPTDVSSNTEQNVSSTNDHKVGVSSSNDWAHVSSSGKDGHSTSTNQNRNSQPTNQNRNIPLPNQNRNTPLSNQHRNNATNQNRKKQSTNQNMDSRTNNQNRNTLTGNPNRGTQLANQTRNPVAPGKKNNLKRPMQKPHPKNKTNNASSEVECSPNVLKETVSSTNSDLDNSLISRNVSSNCNEVTLIDQKANMILTTEISGIVTSPKPNNLSPPKPSNFSSPKPQNVSSTKDVSSSPSKKTKSSSHQRIETSPQQRPLTSPNIKTDGKGSDTSVIPDDDGDSENKLNVRGRSPVKTSPVQNIDPSTSCPSHLSSPQTPSIHHSPSPNKQEFHSEPVTSNTTLHGINTAPIKMASPTSVLPVEATSTIQDDADLDDGIKLSDTSPNAKKQLSFNNHEFIPKPSADESSPIETSKSIDVQPYEVETDNSQSCSNMNPRFVYKDRHNALHSSPPYFSEVPDSDYDQDNESVICNRNNFNNVGFGNEMESNEEGSHYVMDNVEEQNNFMNYNDDIDINRMNSSGNNFRNVHLNNDGVGMNCSNLMDVDDSYVNVLGEEEEDENNYENTGEDDFENYENENWIEGNQYDEESMIGGYDSQSEDVIALDSDEDENDTDDLEFIACIDSPQNKRRGRVPAKLQESMQSDLLFSCPNRGQVAKRGRRGRPAQRGRLVGNAGTATTNDQTTTANSAIGVPPLLHPRLLLNSPQTQTEDSSTPTARRRRGKSGCGSSRATNGICNNTEPSPPKRNQQNGSANTSYTTPPRKRQRPPAQPTMISSTVTPNKDVHTTPPQNKSRKTSQTGTFPTCVQPDLGNSPSSDYSPSRSILTDRTCTICKHAFPNLTLARQHAKQVHPNQHSSPTTAVPSLFCQVCKAMFKTNKDLKSHMLLHSNHNLHKCDVCFRAFKQRSVLMQHLLIHTEELPYACSICEKRFRQQGHLILHLGKHGRNNEGSYTCPHCTIDFTDENLFADHMRQHDAELPFKCNFCQQRFELKSNLMLHLEGHNEGRPFTCHICKKSFKKKTYYFGHMQMHKIRDNQNNTNQENEFDNMEEANYMKN